jgi:hypothetical protein
LPRPQARGDQIRAAPGPVPPGGFVRPKPRPRPLWLRFVLPKPGATSLASLRSPKTRSHLVGFASFSQNQDPPRWLRFVLPKRGPALGGFLSTKAGPTLRWLCSAKNPTRGHLVWSSLTMSNSPIRAAGHLRPDIANFHLDPDIRDLSCGQLKYPFRSRHWMPLALNIVV